MEQISKQAIERAKRNWPIKNSSTRQIAVRVPLDIYDRVRRYCDRQHWTVSQLVVYLLTQVPEVDAANTDDTEEGGTGR